MANPSPTPQLLASVKTVLGYLDDLERAKFDDAQTKLRLVINYFQKDDVVRALAEALRMRTSTGEILERVDGDTLALPGDPRDRLAFFYTLLYHLKQKHKLDLRQVLTRSTFGGGGMEDRWARFAESIVHPLRVGLTAVRGHIPEKSGDVMVQPDDVFQEALNAYARAVGTMSDGVEVQASRPEAAPAEDAAPAVEETPSDGTLTGAIRSAGLTSTVRDDLLVDARILELELTKAKPSQARLDELVASLGSAGDAVSTAAKALVGGE